MSGTVARRGPRIVVGALLIVAGLVAASVMWILSGERRSGAVEDLARAPVGCDTTLDFVEPGSYVVYIETSGELTGVRGDCAVQGVYDIGSTAPDAEITVVDPDGAIVDLGTDVDDISYDDSGFVGSAAFSLDIVEPDDHVIRVESPQDEVFVVAVGRDPSEGVIELRIAAIAVGALGVLLGIVVLVLGLRRGRGDELAPQRSVATPAGRPMSFAPGRAPSGPPTYGPPPGPTPSGPPLQPTRSSEWAPHHGWDEPRPSFGDTPAPARRPPPPPPPTPPLDDPPAASRGPARIPGEPSWGPSSASPPAPPPGLRPAPPAPPPADPEPHDGDRWASPESGDSAGSDDPKGSADAPTSREPPA